MDLGTFNSIATEKPFFSRPGTRPGTAMMRVKKVPELPRKKLKSFKDTVDSYRAKNSDI